MDGNFGKILAGGALALIPMVFTWKAMTFQCKSKKSDISENEASHKSFKDLENDLVRNLQGAIQIETISGNVEGLLKLHKYLEEKFPLVHKTMKRELVEPFSLIYEWTGSDEELDPVICLAHMDVVPVEENSWSVKPFGGEIIDERIYGRGTLDCKGLLMGWLNAAEVAISKGFVPSRTIIFAFGGDEEIGGFEGAKKISQIFEKRGVHAEFMVDEGYGILDNMIAGVDGLVASVCVAEKGFMDLTLSTEDKPGHASMPPKQTAIERLSTAIHKINKNQMPVHLSDGSVSCNMMTQMAMHFTSAVKRSLFANLWLTRPIVKRVLSNNVPFVVRSTMPVTMFNSGTAINILPSKASCEINCRVHPNDSVDCVLNHIKKVINDEKIKAKIGRQLPPSPVSPTSGLGWKAIKTAIAETRGSIPVVPSLMTANTDTRHYWNVCENIYRFNPFVLNADKTARIHGHDEYIEIAEYVKLAEFCFNLITNKDIHKC